MKRMRILGLALVAVFALVAVAASSASAAAPVWAVCAKAPKEGKTYTGKYSNKTCSEVNAESKGEYELVAGIGKKAGFKGKGGKAILHNVIPGKGDVKVECASFKDEGNTAAPNLVYGVKATFSKCKSLGFPCKTEGGKKETITTESLAGELGYVEGSYGTVVGEDLANEKEPGTGLEAHFECEGEAKVRVAGSVIGTLSGDINTISKESTTTYSVGEYLSIPEQPGALSNPPELEGGSPDVLLTELNGPETGNVWVGPLVSGQEGAAVNKGEALEVSTTL